MEVFILFSLFGGVDSESGVVETQSKANGLEN